MGDAIVTVQDKRINLKVINTLEETLELSIPTLKIQEIKRISETIPIEKETKETDRIKQKKEFSKLFQICAEQMHEDETQQLLAQDFPPFPRPIINKKYDNMEPTLGCSWQENIYTIQEEPKARNKLAKFTT